MKRFNTPFPAFICLVLLSLLAICLYSRQDEALFLQLNQLSQKLPDSLWGFITTLADPLVAPLLVFTLFHRKPLFLRAFFIAMPLALLVNYSFKYGFSFDRPSAVLAPNSFNLIGPHIASPSFPSGHTLTIFTLMGLISAWYQERSISIMAILLATIISFSRVSVGAHWPSDLLLGALLGCFIGWIAVEINTKLSESISEKWLLSAYFIGLFTGIFSLINKTPYPAGQWFSTIVALFTIAYSLRSITEQLHRQKG